MKIGEHVFFAPGVTFEQLDLDGTELPDQYRRRVEGYYLDPAELLIRAGSGFAAGLITVAAIDAMSRLYFGPNRLRRVTNRDFRTFARHLLPSFGKPKAADLLWENYRNGLVHEGRVKEGCQFELGRQTTLDLTGPLPLIDPARLLAEVRAALQQLVKEMKESASFRREMAKLLRREFRYELGDAA